MKKAKKFLQNYIDEIVASPERQFWTFALTHLLLWTIVPTLVCANAPLDVIENYAWGQEWLIGTHKHPPMQAWLLETLAVLTDRAPWAHFFASQIAILIAFWAVWQTGRRMLGDKAALIGVLLLEGVIYYNFTSPEFNANILQLPFWALIGWSFYRAIKDNRLIDWVLLGLWAAGGLYSKYSTLLMLVTLALLMVMHPDCRRRLKQPGPYITAIISFLLFLPHILWLLGNDFLPFAYARNQMNPPHRSIFLLLGLVGGQLATLLPVALLMLAVFNRRPEEKDDKLHSFDRAFLCTITFGPFILTFLLAMMAGFKIRDMWATPFWNFIGLWAIFRFRPKFTRESTQRFIYGWLIIFIFTLVGYAGSTLYGPYITNKTQRVHFPGHALAKKISAAWQERYHKPLHYVIGDIWPAGNLAYYMHERPHVLILGDYTISPWIDANDLSRNGGIIIWCVRYCIGRGLTEGAPNFLHEKFPQAEVQPQFTLPRETKAKVDPVIFQWAFLPPDNEE